MPDPTPEQPVDFSHYFEDNKSKSTTPAASVIAMAKGIPGLVMKLSHGLIKTQRQANVILVMLCILCLLGAAAILYTPRVTQQTHVVKPSPLIHPTN